MSTRASRSKACAINPLKASPALGGAIALLGVEGSLPLLHGAQGCTAFALVLAVRHFREAIPLQTTAIGELDAILGGADNVEQAIGNIYERAKPRLIGLLSTALTETRDEDIPGDLKLIRARHPEWSGLDVVFASTPDFVGGFEEGWARVVEALIAAFVEPGPRPPHPPFVNLLPGSHLTPGDVEALKQTIEAFGLSVIALPDLSGSLDGHVAAAYIPTSAGGTCVDDIRRMGRAAMTLAVGEHMRPAAELLHRSSGVPYRVFDGLIGLDGFDAFVAALLDVAVATAPPQIRRQRARLVDAMVDGHSYFGGQRIAIAGDGDMTLALATFFSGMGARVVAAVTSTTSPVLSRLPAERYRVGDFDDFETLVRDAGGCDLIVANSHAEPLAAHLAVPLYRAGFPVYDRLGVAQRTSVGYAGSRQMIFDIANVVIEATPGHGPGACDHHGTEETRARRIDAPVPAY